MRVPLARCFSGLVNVICSPSSGDTTDAGLLTCSAARSWTAGSAARLALRRVRLAPALFLADFGVLGLELFPLLVEGNDCWRVTLRFPLSVVTTSFADSPALRLRNRVHSAFLAFSSPAIFQVEKGFLQRRWPLSLRCHMCQPPFFAHVVLLSLTSTHRHK